MKVVCYADDPKEPEMIGECVINIDEVLKKGEIDGEYPCICRVFTLDWYEFNYKEKYAGGAVRGADILLERECFAKTGIV